jgi:DNA-binding MarR family transcriptional regulator
VEEAAGGGPARGVLRALGRTAAQYSLYGQAVAAQLGIGPTDLECLMLLQDLGPATAGQLAEVLGLTTGAITGVVDRLVAAGFVVRDSDPTDRRRVIVRPVTERGGQLEDAFAPVLRALARSLDTYAESDHYLLLDFQSRACSVLEQETARLKAEQAGTAGASTYGVPLGDLSQGYFEFSNGASDVRIQAAELGAVELYRATFEGAQPSLRVQSGNVTVRYKRMGPFEWGGSKHSGTVALNPSIPWSIVLRDGASGVTVDARGMDLRELRVDGGASKVEVCLPPPRGTVAVCVGGGVSRMQIQRPQGAPLQLQVGGGANRLEFDAQRFGAVGGELRLASPGWELATDRYVVEVRGGASRLTIHEL